ncbi:MAG TPA: fatty acid desaturase [Polyangiales bacterium]|nr:fatty acid desaturase [Polyangiales bacterium]
MDAEARIERTEQEVIKASNQYAHEIRARSWFHLVTTFAGMIGCQTFAALASPWWLRTCLSVVAGLFTVRAFIVYHDFKHGSILRGSKPAKLFLDAFGLYVLTPSTVWTQTHNYHHAHTAKIVGSHVGSYPMLTTALWEKCTPGQRVMYRVIRHPLNILFGYFTVFMYGFCLSAFIRNPRKNLDSLAALFVQLGMIALLWFAFGFEVMFYGLVLPQTVAHALGAYLFYAQHNFPDAHVQPRESWTFVRASLESSSYMEVGPVMRYFTGNIGFHHVHHLNHRIPFYRLPEAMAAIPELRDPHGATSLSLREIRACFRLKLWDPDQNRMVPFP